MNDEDVTALARQRTLIAYLEMKVQQGDWHGVSDAANDLRELEAVHPVLTGLRP